MKIGIECIVCGKALKAEVPDPPDGGNLSINFTKCSSPENPYISRPRPTSARSSATRKPRNGQRHCWTKTPW